MATRNSVLRAAAVLGAVLFWVGVARAEPLININFNSWTPTHGDPGPGIEAESELVGPGGGLGTTWNQYAAPSTSGIVLDSTGADTDIEVATNFTEGRYYDSIGSMELAILRSSLRDFGREASRTVTITGLEPSTHYHVWLPMYQRFPNAVIAERTRGTWSTSNPTTAPSPQVIDGTEGDMEYSTFVAGVNYLFFSHVLSSPDGSIVFNGQGAPGDEDSPDGYRIHLSGLQLLESGAPLGGPVSPTASTVEASPSEILANGIATSTITVTLLDENQIPIAGKDVTLANTAGPQQATITPATAVTTDLSGMATFAVSSTTVGTEVFTATNVTDDNMVITQTAAVEFMVPRGLFSVNIFGYGRQNEGDPWLEEEVRSTVRMDGVKEGGIWSTTAWDDIGPSGFPGTGTTPMVQTITAENGAQATLTVTRGRHGGGSVYRGTSARAPETWDDGNASMQEGHLVGTFHPDEGDWRVKFEISDIPFAHYEAVFYFGHNEAQWRWNADVGGTANMRFNEQIDSDPEGETGGIQFVISYHPTTGARAEPAGHLRPIEEQGDIGNYFVITDLSGPVFRGEIWGESRNHAGPSGFQIQEVVLPPSCTVIIIR